MCWLRKQLGRSRSKAPDAASVRPLAPAQVPSPDADWSAIGAFALTFNGYQYWGSFGRCAEVANRWSDAWYREQRLPPALIELRTCLFFEQRRWRHYGRIPDEEAMTYIRALVRAIGDKARQRSASGDASDERNRRNP